MKYVIFAVDEVKPSKKYQGDPHASAWPFRIIVAGASNSGKTNMILNLLVMNKFYYMFRKKKSSKIGECNVKCDDVILCGHHLNEPKYGIVRNFYKYLAQDKSKPYYEDITFSTLTPDKIPDLKKFNVKRSKLTIFEDVCSDPPAIQKKLFHILVEVATRIFLLFMSHKNFTGFLWIFVKMQRILYSSVVEVQPENLLTL